MSNRLVTRREYVLLWFIAGAIVIGSVVTVWLEKRGRSPVEKEPAIAAAAVAAPQPAAELSVPEEPAQPVQSSAAELSPGPDPAHRETGSGGEIVVEVVGGVRVPGVYRFGRGATVDDAIQCAGGLSADGDTTSLNRAAPLLPATKLTVPRKRSAGRIDGRVALTIPDPVENIPQYRAGWTGSGTGSAGTTTDQFRPLVNINRASAAELETLPRIGPKTAQAIIGHRRTKPFARIEDIMEVPRIGPKTFETLRPFITVNGSR